VRGAAPGAARAVRGCLAAVLLLAAIGCAGQAPPAAEPSQPPPGQARGYRALFRGRLEGDEARARFRMAAALRPPDGIRLEFFPPVGGARLIVASDGVAAVALMPLERSYAREAATGGIMDRLLGLPLDGEGLIALLTGRPLCAADAADGQVQSGAPATFGRQPSWYEIECPPAELRYLARSRERGGDLTEATIREGLSGDIILRVEYDDYVARAGARWPRSIQMELARTGSKVSLMAIEGPQPGLLADAIFSPAVPAGFSPSPVVPALTAPGLFGSSARPE
jgi:hypothetical protein